MSLSSKSKINLFQFPRLLHLTKTRISDSKKWYNKKNSRSFHKEYIYNLEYSMADSPFLKLLIHN